MQNFTLREPPESSGIPEYDYEELLEWCRELYESLWMNDFILVQERKTQGGDANEE